MSLINKVLLFQVFVMVLGCQEIGPSHSHADEQGSMLHFSPSLGTRSISLRHARASVFKVCTKGPTTAKLDQDVIKAVLIWFRAVRVIDEKITSNIQISCSQPHLTINMRAGSSVSYASPSNVVFYTGRPFGTLVHELGHALAGLGDTYTGRQAGQCQAGQPQSNMCWGAYGPRTDQEKYSGLWPDDIKGIQSQHRIIFGKALAPASADKIDPEAPFSVDSPWPTGDQDEGEDDIDINDLDENNFVIENGADVKPIFTALGKDIQGSAPFFFSVPKDSRVVFFCAGDLSAAECWKSSEKQLANKIDSGAAGARYQSRYDVSPTAVKIYSVFATSEHTEAKTTLLAKQVLGFDKK